MEEVDDDNGSVESPYGVAKSKLEASGPIFHAIGSSNPDREENKPNDNQPNGGLRKMVNGR